MAVSAWNSINTELHLKKLQNNSKAQCKEEIFNLLLGKYCQIQLFCIHFRKFVLCCVFPLVQLQPLSQMSGHCPSYFKFQICDHLSVSNGLHYFQSLAPIVCSEYSRRLTCERAQGCWVGVVGCRVLCNFFCLGFQKGSGYLSSLCLVGSLLVNFCKKRYTFFFFFFFF